MEEEKKRPRIFYGWWIMLGAALCGFVTSGGIQTIAVAAPYLEDEFGWSRTTIVGTAAVGALVVGLSGLAAGYLVDRIGPRLTVIIGTIIGAAGLMLASLTNEPWMWYLSLGFLGATGVAFGGTIAPISTLRRWFMKRAAMTISLALVGSGLGVVLLVPLYSSLMESLGWRTTYIISGLIVIVGGLVGGVLLRKDPESYAMHPDGVAPDPQQVKERLDFISRGEMWSVAEAVRNRNFWFLILAQTFGMLVFAGFYPHVILWGRDIGLTNAAAASVMAFFATATIIGRVLGGAISDWYMARFPKMTRKPIAYVNVIGVLVGTVLCATVVNSYTTMLVVLITAGFAFSIGISIYPTYLGDLFGVMNLPRLMGVRMLAIVLIGAASPVFVGYTFDKTGAYTMAFWVGAAVCVVSLVMLALIKQPQKRVVSDSIL
jgi:MFS family permease